MSVHLTDDTTVDAISAVTIVPALYDSAGCLIPGMPVVTFYILEALLFSCVLGMLFFSYCNPVINWAGCTVTFGFLAMLYSLQQPAATIELCSLHALYKTLCKIPGDAWYCILQPVASCLSMGDNIAPGVG